eukprot:TCONS_00023556-protein
MLLMVFLHSITHKMKVKTISCDELANQICSLAYHVMCIDTRSMLQYNDNHVRDAINICCSKIIRRKLQYNRISVVDLIKNNNESQEDDLWNRLHQVVLYDEASWWGDGHRFNSQHALYILVEKLKQFVPSVALLDGGFSEFAYKFPKLCDSKIKSNCPLLSISTPCASAGSINCPPTKILPFLYLGCEEDALSEDILKTCHVKYVLNASHSAVDSPYCTTGRYLRIPIKDNSSENIVAWFQTAFDFIDKVKESDDHILIHCVGGVSRSATIAIAYVMKHFSLSLDNAYRYVKNKRPTISPNLNFMGQLVQYEQQLLQETSLINAPLSELNLDSPTESLRKGLVLNDDVTDDISGFPSPLSDECSVPSPALDDKTTVSCLDSGAFTDVACGYANRLEIFPSPGSDDVPSPTGSELSNCSEFYDMTASNSTNNLPTRLSTATNALHKPLSLELNLKKKKVPSRTGFTLELDTKKR